MSTRQRIKALCLVLLLTAGSATSNAQESKQVEAKNPLLGLFPDYQAPCDYSTKSAFQVHKVPNQFGLGGWKCKWNPEVDEKDVFHARMRHSSTCERNWEMGIGKGGQIYSLYTNLFGEMIPPQIYEMSKWNDETWQFVTDLGLPGREKLPKHDRFPAGNYFIHGSGIYTKDGIEPFYNPILATHLDEEKRSYSMLNWGQIPTPSHVNRSQVLIYSHYRDLGAGVIEVSYVIYNFGKFPMSNLSPWGGVRTTTFPEHVISNPDGSYRYFTPLHYGYSKDDGRSLSIDKTGGWGAAVQNADNPYGYAVGVVFGTTLEKKGNHRAPTTYSVGDSFHGSRDYTVQTFSVNIKDEPGTPHLLRYYFVIGGSLKQVAEKANKLAKFADYEPLDLTQKKTPLVPLYPKQYDKDTVLSKEKSEGKAVCRVYAWPVKNSVPLFVIKNNETDCHFVTTDPYAQCASDPYSFENPFKPGDALFEKYQNLTIYRPYLKKTDWVELLGFVMPKEKADTKNFKYVPLSMIPTIEDSFDPGEDLDAIDLMVRAE